MSIRQEMLAGKIRPGILKLARDKKLIEKCFQEFCRVVYPGAPKDQIRELRTSFFAGAAELQAMMIYGSSSGMEVNQKDMKFMKGISDEMEIFHQRTIKTANADLNRSTKH